MVQQEKETKIFHYGFIFIIRKNRIFSGFVNNTFQFLMFDLANLILI